MSDEVFFNKMVTKGLEPIESDGRFFEGYLTVQVKDKQGEVTIVDELYKVLPIWMDRGAPITDTHSNRVIGKGINFARAEYTDSDGTIYPAIKVTGKIYKDYELDNEIWSKIKSGEYKGLSFGGSTKTDREPMRMKDGSIAYSLSKLEHYEVAVCKDPAVPLAVITDINPIAKANMNCDHTGCYVTKPVLGAANFNAATRKVMEESNVPEANAKRIVGAAEASAKRNSKEAAVICKHCGLPKKSEGANEPEYHDESIIKGKQVKSKKKKKKEAQGIGNKRSWGAFKSLVDTNKILNLYQGNILPLARILDKVSLPVRDENTGEVTSEGTVAGTGRQSKEEKKLGDKARHKLHFDKLRERKRQIYRPNEAKDRKNMIPTDAQIAGKKAKKEKEALALANLVAAKRKRVAIANAGATNTAAIAAHRKRNLVGRGNKGRDRGRKISDIKEESIIDEKKSLFNKIYDKIKDAPKDIARPNQTGNVPAGKKKEPKGQSHGAQSTRERERGIIEQQQSPDLEHYSAPMSMDSRRTTVPNEELGGMDQWEGEKLEYKRGRRPYDSMIKPNSILGDPRARKSLFDKIKEDIAKKN
jgi:hypothetical protein